MNIVVEGKNDYNKIKSVFKDVYILQTNGSALEDEFINMLKSIEKSHEIVLCLDPDFAGEKIRRIISSHIPNVNHVYARPDLAKSKNGKKIGIEHMSNNDIKKLFYNIKRPVIKNNFNMQDMHDLGLSGSKDSKKLRMSIGEKLKIGYGNAKQFLYRLNMVNITKEELRNLYDC